MSTFGIRRFGKKRQTNCRCTYNFTCGECLSMAPLYYNSPTTITERNQVQVNQAQNKKETMNMDDKTRKVVADYWGVYLRSSDPDGFGLDIIRPDVRDEAGVRALYRTLRERYKNAEDREDMVIVHTIRYRKAK